MIIFVPYKGRDSMEIKWRHIVLWIMLPAVTAWGQDSLQWHLYESILEMQVTSYRLSRDKLYEIYYPDFALIQPDMAQAITISENTIGQILEAIDGTEMERSFGAVEDIWNQMRLGMLNPLTEKEFVKFYYDCKTMDQLLTVMADSLESKLEKKYPSIRETRLKYEIRKLIFITNIGYMTQNYPLSQSLQNILPKAVLKTKSYLNEIRKRHARNGTLTTPMLAKVLNDWHFYYFNLHNALFSPEQTLFSMANSLNLHIYLMFKPSKTFARS